MHGRCWRGQCGVLAVSRGFKLWLRLGDEGLRRGLPGQTSDSPRKAAHRRCPACFDQPPRLSLSLAPCLYRHMSARATGHLQLGRQDGPPRPGHWGHRVRHGASGRRGQVRGIQPATRLSSPPGGPPGAAAAAAAGVGRPGCAAVGRRDLRAPRRSAGWQRACAGGGVQSRRPTAGGGWVTHCVLGSTGRCSQRVCARARVCVCICCTPCWLRGGSRRCLAHCLLSLSCANALPSRCVPYVPPAPPARPE